MNPEEADQLIQKYVMGTLTESEAEVFAGYLELDEAHEVRRRLRLALRADTYLQEAAAYQDEEVAAAVPKRQGITLERVLWPLGSVLLACVVGMFVWQQSQEKSTLEHSSLAVIQRIEGTGGKNGGTPLVDGSRLHAGDVVTLERGLVEIVYRDTGIHAIATAPLKMTLENSMQVYLKQGDLKLNVPPQGIGFVVKTDQREITDLGTTFVVSAQPKKSKLLVLDGLVSVAKQSGMGSEYFTQGEAVTFSNGGDHKHLMDKVQKVPEIAWAAPRGGGLPGALYTLPGGNLPSPKEMEDTIGLRFRPLVDSGFRDRSSIAGLLTHEVSAPFFGVAGAYSTFAAEQGVAAPLVNRSGWLAWHSGKVLPPRSGRYRLWGYGDNTLVAAVDGQVVFEGCRTDSAFRGLGADVRNSHPAWPCLNSQEGFNSGAWFEVGDEPVQLDLLFGEKRGTLTYGLLLIEREGDSYDETYYGQPRWPVFLTLSPSSEDRQQLLRLNDYLEAKLLGAFSVDGAVWAPVEG